MVAGLAALLAGLLVAPRVARVGAAAGAEVPELCADMLFSLRGRDDVEVAAVCRQWLPLQTCKAARQRLGAQPWAPEHVESVCLEWSGTAEAQLVSNRVLHDKTLYDHKPHDKAYGQPHYQDHTVHLIYRRYPEDAHTDSYCYEYVTGDIPSYAVDYDSLDHAALKKCVPCTSVILYHAHYKADAHEGQGYDQDYDYDYEGKYEKRTVHWKHLEARPAFIAAAVVAAAASSGAVITWRRRWSRLSAAQDSRRVEFVMREAGGQE